MNQARREPPQPLEDLAHMSWARRDGAPSDIAALAQTRDGYLWIGSRLGLFRFDGLQFSSYPFTASDPRLPSSDISALAAAPDGGLWIGYRMGGISYLRGSRKIDYGKQNGLLSESTEQLVCLPDGSTWATADGRIMHLAGDKWENYSALHGLPSDGLYSLFFDRDGNLWTASKNELAELKHGAAHFTTTAMPNTAINQFAQLPDGALWIANAWKNIAPLHGEAKDAVRIPGVPVMIVDHSGSIWLAQDFGGVTRIRNPGRPNRDVNVYSAGNGLTDGQTRAIFEDRQGAIWVGTARGLDRFQRASLVQFHGVHLDYYPALAADAHYGIWFNDMDKPLMRLRSGQLSFAGQQQHGSSSLYQDPAGRVWLIDPITHSLYGYPAGGGAPSRIPAPPLARDVETWCIGQDAQGAMLACVEGHGLWRYSGADWQRVTAPGLPEDPPLSLMRGDSGRVWMGFAHNQIAINTVSHVVPNVVPKNPTGMQPGNAAEKATGDRSSYRLFGRDQGLEINSVLSFYDAEGLVLAGGSDGLASFDGTSFHSLHLRTQSLLRGISGIVKDRWGDLWLNAAPGILRVREAEWKAALRDPQYAMDFQFFNERDGLIGTPSQGKPAPSAVQDKAGLLWFATSGHLFSLDPGSVRQGDAKPNVLLQAVFLNGSAVPHIDGPAITIGSRHLKTLELDYIGVDLDAPERVTYQYMLVGQDKEWQTAGDRRQAYYTNLAPGSYSFRVRAASGTGAWNELQTGFHLNVRPAYYQTIWFIALCVALLAVFLWALYGVRLKHHTAMVKERLEERAYERVRIARDLHDTLLQGVQGLVLRFHFATEQLPADEPARAMLRDALDRADLIISEGRDKVRELRAEPSSMRNLESDLRQAMDAIQAEGSARVSLLVIGSPRPLHTVVQDELYHIGREALNNAMRHARASQIEVELSYETSRLQLRCRDDGAGVSPEVLRAGAKDGHWGIVGMRERATRLGSKLEFWSAPHRGTEIGVIVPGRKAYAKARNGTRRRNKRVRSNPEVQTP